LILSVVGVGASGGRKAVRTESTTGASGVGR